MESPSFDDGLRSVKEVIMKLLPHIQRVVDVNYEPYKITSKEMDQEEVTTEEYVLIMRVIGFQVLGELPLGTLDPTITVSFMGNDIHSHTTALPLLLKKESRTTQFLSPIGEKDDSRTPLAGKKYKVNSRKFS
jgi:hypothetical protein